MSKHLTIHAIDTCLIRLEEDLAEIRRTQCHSGSRSICVLELRDAERRVETLHALRDLFIKANRAFLPPTRRSFFHRLFGIGIASVAILFSSAAILEHRPPATARRSGIPDNSSLIVLDGGRAATVGMMPAGFKPNRF